MLNNSAPTRGQTVSSCHKHCLNIYLFSDTECVQPSKGSSLCSECDEGRVRKQATAASHWVVSWSPLCSWSCTPEGLGPVHLVVCFVPTPPMVQAPLCWYKNSRYWKGTQRGEWGVAVILYVRTYVLVCMYYIVLYVPITCGLAVHCVILICIVLRCVFFCIMIWYVVRYVHFVHTYCTLLLYWTTYVRTYVRCMLNYVVLWWIVTTCVVLCCTVLCLLPCVVWNWVCCLRPAPHDPLTTVLSLHYCLPRNWRKCAKATILYWAMQSRGYVQSIRWVCVWLY